MTIKFSAVSLHDGGGKLKADWFVYWYETGPDGIRVQKRIRGGINRQKTIRAKREFAAALLRVVEKRLAAGIRPGEGKSGNVPVCDYLRGLLDADQNNLRSRTFDSYHYAINKFESYLTEKGESLTVGEVGKHHAREFLSTQLRQGMRGKSINGLRGFMHRVFNYWCNEMDGRINPFKGSPVMNEESGKNVAFTDQERGQLWEVLRKEDPKLYLFTRFQYFLYARPNEITRLKIRDIKFDIGEIVILGGSGKNRKQMSVVIPDIFLEEIVHLRHYPGDYAIFSYRLMPGKHHLGRNFVTERHKGYLRRLGINPLCTLYSWKHTGVVAAYRNGIKLYDIMRQLRHHDLGMVQIYMKSLGLVRNTEFAEKMI